MITSSIVLHIGKLTDGKLSKLDTIDFCLSGKYSEYSTNNIESENVNDWLSNYKYDDEIDYAELYFSVPEFDKSFLIASFSKIKTKTKN